MRYGWRVTTFPFYQPMSLSARWSKRCYTYKPFAEVGRGVEEPRLASKRPSRPQ